MYGDPDVLRSRVDDLREQAVDVRALADHLVSQTDGLGWSGRAADAMRLRVAERAGHLRAAAGQHDTAADTLENHVQELEMLGESIAAIERRVRDLVADAGDDDPIRAFDPPPTGHRDWLDIEVPGL